MVRLRAIAAYGRLQGRIHFAPKSEGSNTRPDTFAEFTKNVLYQMDTANVDWLFMGRLNPPDVDNR